MLDRALIGCCVLVMNLAVAQLPSQQKSRPTAAVDNDFVQKEFGSSCTLVAGPPTLTADLDGDGVEDVVIAARCTNPFPDQAEDSFAIIDPYYTYFGFGDPKVTTGFASEDPKLKGLALLIIHGAGPEAWRSPVPRAKFVIVNLPYRQIAVKKLTVHKKTIMAIFIEESEGNQTVSTVYWDGKKYKYMPLGSSME